MVPRRNNSGARARREREARAAAEAAASAARQRQIEADAKAKMEALAAEQARLAEEKAKAEFDAQVLAEDIQIQERSQNRNRMANDTLARMNQSQQTSDTQTRAIQAGRASSGMAGAGQGFDIQKQREAAQQKVGAAMSAAPSGSGFAGKAAAVSPVNATSQTANTGIIQGTNKSPDINQIVAERANKDSATRNQFSGVRSKAPNMGSPNSFNPPNTEGIQIGEAPINKY